MKKRADRMEEAITGLAVHKALTKSQETMRRTLGAAMTEVTDMRKGFSLTGPKHLYCMETNTATVRLRMTSSGEESLIFFPPVYIGSIISIRLGS